MKGIAVGAELAVQGESDEYGAGGVDDGDPQQLALQVFGFLFPVGVHAESSLSFR